MFKKSAICLFLFISLISCSKESTIVQASQAVDDHLVTTSLSWDPSPSSEVVGYKIYYNTLSSFPLNGVDSIDGESPIDVGANLTGKVRFHKDGYVCQFFAVTAYDGAGYESAYSNVVSSCD